jgi:hypothetical protein
MLSDCTELYLGSKGIEQLAGFERLTNLEVLWVNDNKLAAITGLDSNVRVKQLYAHVSGCQHPRYACRRQTDAATAVFRTGYQQHA